MMRQDAHEKAFEIQILGQRIFEQARDKQILKDEQALEKEYQEKSQNLAIQQKIAASTKTNEVRIKRMNCRNDCLEKLKEETKTRLIEVMKSNPDLYRATLKNLIIQGMIKLLEENVELLCRNRGEEEMVKGMLKECQKEYSELMKEKTGRDYATKLSVIPDKYMSEDQGSEVGGIILLAHERRIVVANSLQDRLHLCFEQQLPQIRRQLFPS